VPAETIRESIEKAREYLQGHSEEARYTDSEARAVVEQDLRCRVEGPAGAEIFTDMVTAVGGGASAPSPGWILRAALASCDATVIAMRAAELGITLDVLEVVVDSESDDRGLLAAAEDVPAGPLSARIRVRLSAQGASDEQLRELVEWADAHCPVSDAVRRAVPTAVDIQTAG
jgi:uncharacterized OsmC-like protein